MGAVVTTGVIAPARGLGSSATTGPPVVERWVVDIQIDGRVVGLARLGKRLVGLTERGTVLFSRDERQWRATDTDGIDATRVTGMAAFGETLVAVGSRSSEGEARPLVWRSSDGVHWEKLATTTLLPDGTAGVALSGVATDDRGFLAFGTVYGVECCPPDDADQYHTDAAALWRSVDAESWQLVDTLGLNDPEEYGYQNVQSLVARGAQMLAVQLADCLDCDPSVYRILVAVSEVETQWALYESRCSGPGCHGPQYDGLDAFFDEPVEEEVYEDTAPAVVVVGNRYIALGTKLRARDDQDADDVELGLWLSDDGSTWTPGPGATKRAKGTVDAVTTDADVAVAVRATSDGLVVWSISP